MPASAVPSNEAIDDSGFNPLLLYQLMNCALGRRRSRGASIYSLRARRLGQPLHHHDRPLRPSRRVGRACAERPTHPLARPKFRGPARRARRLLGRLQQLAWISTGPCAPAPGSPSSFPAVMTGAAASSPWLQRATSRPGAAGCGTRASVRAARVHLGQRRGGPRRGGHRFFKLTG